jgi:pimeloyl-ACP methyl ester carboxylesterase
MFPAGMLARDRSLIAADGTRIAYRRQGEGPALLLCNGITTSDFFWRYLAPRWARRFTVITWDLKGHGRSEPARTTGGVTMPALAKDALQILDAEGIAEAAVVGFSMGCQVALEIYRAAPERVRGLVLLLGPSGRVFDTALGPVGPLLHALIRRLPPPGFRLAFRGMRGVVGMPGSHRLGRLLRLVGPDAATADVQRYVEHFVRDLDPGTLAAMALAAQEHCARALLPTITAPTLVVAGDRDVFAPAPLVGLPLHQAIPGSRLLRLPEGTHTSLFEHHEEIGAAVERFCEGLTARREVG